MIVHFRSLPHLGKPPLDILGQSHDLGINRIGLLMEEVILLARDAINMDAQLLLSSSNLGIVGGEEGRLCVEIVDELVHPEKERIDPLVYTIFRARDLFLARFHGFVNGAGANVGDASYN